MLKTIMGLVTPTGGHVRLQGVDLAGERAYRIARAGIAYVPEERGISANITVDENMRIGMQGARSGVPKWAPEQMYAYFPSSRSGAGSLPACCRAGSSRCSRSAGRCSATRA